MQMMQWNNVLATGVTTIDNQHKKLLELTNQLGGAIERGDVEIVELVLKDLVDYTVYHFSFEEELMEKAGYAALPLHRRVHQLFTARLPEFQQRYEAGEDVLRELHDMLVKWLLNHIQNEDRDYAETVRAYLLEHMNSRFSAAPPSRFAEDAPSTRFPVGVASQFQPSQPPATRAPGTTTRPAPLQPAQPATRAPGATTRPAPLQPAQPEATTRPAPLQPAAPAQPAAQPRPAAPAQPAAPKRGLLQRIAAFFMEEW